MEAALEQIRDQQRDSWNRFSPGWKEWDDFMLKFLDPIGREMIRVLAPAEGESVLDIAAGTGEPGLTIASMVGNGKVVLTDVAERMLEIAAENARNRHLTNVKTETSDVSSLPFGNDTFDIVNCRLGFMYFPDMQLASSEMFRVLKPGGRIATAVWNIPDKNPWVTTVMGAVNKHIQLPPPPPGAPSIFRCSQSGAISGMFEKSGFNNISETEVWHQVNFQDAEEYWRFHTAVSAPVVGALSKSDEATRNNIRNEVFDALKNKYPDGNLSMDFSAIVIHAEK